MILNVESEKKTAVSNKSQTGKVLTYALTLNFEITAKKENNILFYDILLIFDIFLKSDRWFLTVLTTSDALQRSELRNHPTFDEKRRGNFIIFQVFWHWYNSKPFKQIPWPEMPSLLKCRCKPHRPSSMHREPTEVPILRRTENIKGVTT